MNLYSTHAKEFSDTRQAPWQGWERVMNNEQLTINNLKILDLGCGNGRFLKFAMSDLRFTICKYVGLDNSIELLSIAENSLFNRKSQIINQKFLQVDLNNINWTENLEGKFNLIVGFGLMHHIDSFEARKNIYKKSFELLEEGGMLVLTYWQFTSMKRFEGKMKKVKVSNDSFSENDFTLPFGNNGAERFCHYADETEIKMLEEGVGFRELDRFLDEGKVRDQNLYLVYGKNLQ